MRKKISPALFGIAIICFFLPFVTVSCGGQKVMSLTGIQLATGTTIEQPSIYGQKQTQKINGEPLAIFAILSAFVGLCVSVMTIKKNNIIVALISGTGAGLLLLLKSKMDNDILTQGQGVLQTGYAIGFWLAFLFQAAIMVLNVFLLSENKNEVSNISLGNDQT